MIALTKIIATSISSLAAATAFAATPPTMLNSPVEISGDFHATETH